MLITFWELKRYMTELPKKTKVNKKRWPILIRINTAERDEFINLCDNLDTSAARELRKYIRSFIKKHQSTEKLTKSNIVAKQVKSTRNKLKRA